MIDKGINKPLVIGNKKILKKAYSLIKFSIGKFNIINVKYRAGNTIYKSYLRYVTRKIYIKA